MSLADEVAELRRRVADMVRRGVVDEVIPGSSVMVRVDIGDVLSPPLPWIQVQSGRYYGSAGLNQSLAAVLEANPGLADLGPLYPSGVEIVLPDWTYEPEEKEVFQLWS